MKKYVAFILALVMIAGLCACGNTAPAAPAEPAAPAAPADPAAPAAPAAPVEEEPSVADDPKVTLSLGLVSAADDLATISFERFAENVAEKSGGSVIINVFPASQLGSAVAQLESVIAGAQDMSVDGELVMEADFGVPDLKAQSYGTLNTSEKLKTFLASSVYKEYNEQFRQKNGVVTVANNWIRTPIIICLKQPAYTMDDFKGVKLRTVPSASSVAAYSALGFDPTTVDYSEVYMSLAQGVIDGTICPFEGAYTMKFYEQAPYVLLASTNVTNNALWFNEAKWNSLTQRQRDVITECALEAGDWYTSEIEGMMQEYIANMEAGGATIIQPDQAMLDGIAAALESVALKEVEAGNITLEGYESIRDAALGLID